MRRVLMAGIAGALLSGCPTERNPTYCDLPDHCPGEMCDLSTHMCVPIPDTAIPIDASFDADTEMCERAGGRLVWVSDRDGDTEIVTAYADGSGFRALTDNSFADENPRVSYDGSKIAWLSSPTGVAELFVMDVDAGNPVNVSSQGEGPLFAEDPVWSSNQLLAFASERAGASNIYIVNADGSGFDSISIAGGARSPTWAPKANQIAYQRIVGGNTDIYRVSVGGSGSITVRLTTQTDFDGAPQWSPEGSTIAYISKQPTVREIWSMTTTGSSQAVLVPGVPTNIQDFQWSADGSRLVLQWNDDIEVVDADGTNRVNLTDDDYSDYDPSWSPDAEHIVFMSTRDGNEEIHTMLDNGLEITNVSNDSGEDTDPSWFGCP